MVFQVKLLALSATIYFTWMSRNRLIFDNEKINPEGCANNIIRACKYRLRVKGKFKTITDRNMRDRMDV